LVCLAFVNKYNLEKQYEKEIAAHIERYRTDRETQEPEMIKIVMACPAWQPQMGDVLRLMEEEKSDEELDSDESSPMNEID